MEKMINIEKIHKFQSLPNIGRTSKSRNIRKAENEAYMENIRSANKILKNLQEKYMKWENYDEIAL
jgi:uncharacterized UPF0160 family protein